MALYVHLLVSTQLVTAVILPPGCGSGTVCSRSQKDLAFCDICDFDPYTYMCGSLRGHHTTVPTPAPPHPADNCVTDKERIYSGLDLDFLGN